MVFSKTGTLATATPTDHPCLRRIGCASHLDAALLPREATRISFIVVVTPTERQALTDVG
jgi:hypothetical protein